MRFGFMPQKYRKFKHYELMRITVTSMRDPPSSKEVSFISAITTFFMHSYAHHPPSSKEVIPFIPFLEHAHYTGLV
jgi:hypothetical protein